MFLHARFPSVALECPILALKTHHRQTQQTVDYDYGNHISNPFSLLSRSVAIPLQDGGTRNSVVQSTARVAASFLSAGMEERMDAHNPKDGRRPL